MSLPQRLAPLLPGEERSPNGAVVPRRYVRRRVRRQGDNHRGMALERGLMLTVNGVISVIAVVTIAQLLPHNASQQRKLRALEAEVGALDHRVDQLRDEFVLYFDPQQTRSNIRRLSDRLDAGQRKVILSDPAPGTEYPDEDAGVDTGTAADANTSTAGAVTHREAQE